MSKYLPTGNEFVSLPTIREEDGAIKAAGFLCHSLRVSVEKKKHKEVKP